MVTPHTHGYTRDANAAVSTHTSVKIPNTKYHSHSIPLQHSQCDQRLFLTLHSFIHHTHTPLIIMVVKPWFDHHSHRSHTVPIIPTSFSHSHYSLLSWVDPLFVLGLKFDRHRVDTMSFIGGCGKPLTLKHVSQMSTTILACNLHTTHAVGVVFCALHCTIYIVIECWPSTSCLGCCTGVRCFIQGKHAWRVTLNTPFPTSRHAHSMQATCSIQAHHLFHHPPTTHPHT